MLLTLKQPAYDGPKSFHESSLPTPPATTKFSPAVTGSSLPSLPFTTAYTMSTAHRGLPPPAAMTLPAHSPAPPTQPLGPSVAQSAGQLPAPPTEWRNAEESMRNWLQAKQEEDKRKQEEEKTRQETLRLEQRRIEQSMLHESFQNGIPPYMVPMVFAGMGGGNLPNASLEWAQHYMAQVHHLQQQQAQAQQQQQQQQQQQALPQPQHSSPEGRRDSRHVAQPQPNPYASQQPVQQILPQQAQAGPVPQPPQTATFLTPYQPPAMSPSLRPGPPQLPGQPGQAASASRTSAQGALPRLSTDEMQTQGPPVEGHRASALHPLHQSQSIQHAAQPSSQDQNQSSPSIYFHHWVPPTSQPGSKDSKETPSTPSDQTTSPKKRKATGPHQAAPPPSGQPSYTSPTFSQGSTTSTPSHRRPGHSRNRSDASSRTFESRGRPSSRHRQAEGNGATGPSGPSGPGSSQQGPPSGSTSDLSGASHQTPPHQHPPQGGAQSHAQAEQMRRYSAGSETGLEGEGSPEGSAGFQERTDGERASRQQIRRDEASA